MASPRLLCKQLVPGALKIGGFTSLHMNLLKIWSVANSLFHVWGLPGANTSPAFSAWHVFSFCHSCWEQHLGCRKSDVQYPKGSTWLSSSTLGLGDLFAGPGTGTFPQALHRAWVCPFSSSFGKHCCGWAWLVYGLLFYPILCFLKHFSLCPVKPSMWIELQAHTGMWPCSGFPSLLIDAVFKLQKDIKRAWTDFHQVGFKGKSLQSLSHGVFHCLSYATSHETVLSWQWALGFVQGLHAVRRFMPFQNSTLSRLKTSYVLISIRAL